MVRAGANDRFELDGLAEVFQGFVELAELPQHDPEVIVRRAELGPEFQGPTELHHGIGLLPQSLQGQAQVAEGLGVVRPEAQGRATTPHGPIQLARGSIGFGQIGVESRHIRPDRNGPADQLDRLRVIPLLMVQHTQQVHRHRVFLLLSQDLLIQRRGLGQTAPLMHLDGRREDVLHGVEIPKYSRSCGDV